MGHLKRDLKSNYLYWSIKDYFKRPRGGVGICEGSLGCEFLRGRCVLRKWVVGGGALDGYFGEQGLSAGIQECLERFHRRCVDYLSRQCVPKCDCPNGEGELATARTASLLVELECVDA